MEREVVERLTSIETKLDRFLDDIKDHESRIRHIEKWQWGLMGGAAVVSFIVASAFHYFK